MLEPSSRRPSGRKVSVRRSPIHGRGVFATRPIRSGELICEYKGERIEWTEAIRRHPRDSSQPNHTFYFDCGDGTVIDGSVGGNNARWINHACLPNCEAEDQEGRIFIRAIRPILIGEEISIDYTLVVEARLTRQLRLQYACHCGASCCRGTMLAEHQKRTASMPATAGVANGLAGWPPVTQASVRVFERPNPSLLIASWREAGRCCYSEQHWTLTEATVSGTCALSGRTFATGERVFQPIGQPAPANQHARITESAVNEIVDMAGMVIW